MKIISCIAILTAVAGWTLSGTSAEDKKQLVLTGSSTVAPLALEIGKRFEAAHPGTRIDVQTGGSSRGIADARAGTADIGLVSRALKADESDLKAFTIALDGVAVILHRDNPVAELTDAQIVAIYSGKTTDWKDVSGKPGKITVVSKAEGRSTLELFLAHFGLEAPEIKAHTVIGDNEQGIKTVAGNPAAIGYVSIGSAEYGATNGVPIKLLPMAGVAASTGNVQSKAFPLSRPLNLVTKSEPQGLVKQFLAFAQSDQVVDLVKAQYFVAVAAAPKS